LVAYASNESGRYDVLVQRFVDRPDAAAASSETIPVSTAGGVRPKWRENGRELYFISPEGAVMAAEIRVSPKLSVGVIRELFRLTGSHGGWDVLSDGSGFLIAIPSGADASAPFSLLTDRLAELRARRSR
jgi:hypothetical protein